MESGDARVQDAVCLVSVKRFCNFIIISCISRHELRIVLIIYDLKQIMDRFAVLQEHMNDAYVRKQLTIKVKHSIHCKKWRLKRHKMSEYIS